MENFFDVQIEPTRSAFKARNYKQDRRAIIARLGGRCQGCGTTDKLELDHIARNGCCLPRKLNRWTRIKHYLEEKKKGNLQVLCRSCNAKKG